MTGSEGPLEIVFLGTGTSHGVPMIGCDCPVCRSDDPRDRRNRASAAVITGRGRVILIDAAPELRIAAVAQGLARVDAVCFTHTHADHIFGLDDIRRFNDIAGATIPCYASAESVRVLRQVFGYAEVPYEQTPASRPSVRFEVIDAPRSICGLQVVPIPLLHSTEPILGFRMGPLAYCTDCSAIPQESRRLLSGLEVLVLDSLRHTPHPAHFTLAGALEVVADLKPRRALLTHLTHQLPHEQTGRLLPDGVKLAYDGLRVRIDS